MITTTISKKKHLAQCLDSIKVFLETKKYSIYNIINTVYFFTLSQSFERLSYERWVIYLSFGQMTAIALTQFLQLLFVDYLNMPKWHQEQFCMMKEE
jgi:hypothetical protein